ncbi:unnamed protein product [Ostreobium quekettii]|uniref:Gamma-tubulin complex component n=1 Tax=Ostreobium quekettii TaxID=121088 RepID=A0A8S1IRM9_9CHLO|nr:unnamed protein product [Ostreobium quekettii]|eukprot:evm.model.scf_12EXC.2 EVM.evm.TU.scf_12EXC.2   scf_12EXC:18738-28506(+)
MTAGKASEGGLSYSNLLQELLLALLGHAGDVFVDKATNRGVFNLSDPDAPSFQLSDDISSVARPDRELLNDLVKLGFHYRALDVFVEKEGVPSPSSVGGGMYRRALAAGVSELLAVYKAAILQIQQHLMTEATPVIPAIRHFLIDFEALLPHLHRLVHHVERDGINGSQLLGLLHSSSRCGLPTLQSCLQRLLWHCNQVLYKQLSGWIVHGLLLDRSREFFIHEVSDPNGALLGDQDGEGELDEWHKGFEVQLTALPPYISLTTAESVKFIGQAVRLLRQPSGNFQGQELMPYRDTLAFAEALRKLQEQPVFNRVALERVVEAVRTKVASHLWHLVVVKAELPSHLQALKDYFLMAKGEFYHNFLVEGSRVMNLPPREATAEADINVPFQQSALKSTAQHDKFFQLIRLQWRKDDIQVVLGPKRFLQVPRYDEYWDNMYLSYKVGWPLGLIITPAVLARYNGMFQYLLRLKRVQLGLEEAWQSMCSRNWRGDTRSGGVSSSRLPLWQLRQHMAHFITNLQIYIQVDVIESNYAQLQQRIADAQDFMEAERAHNRYLSTLIFQSFLSTVSISRLLQQVFRACHSLCTMVRLDDGSPTCDAADWRKVERLGREFNASVGSFYSLLQSDRLQEQSKAPSLRRFFLRLNFNDYVARTSLESYRQEIASAGGEGSARGKG